MTSAAKNDHADAPAEGRAEQRSVQVALPYEPLWNVARALIGTETGVVFLDGGGDTEASRWSFLAWNPRRVVTWPQGHAGALEELRACFADGDAATAVDTAPSDGRVPFRGGWMGWFSYDLGRHFERLPSSARADDSIPDFVIGEYDLVLAEDRIRRELWVAGRCTVDAGEDELVARTEAVLQRATETIAAEKGPGPVRSAAADEDEEAEDSDETTPLDADTGGTRRSSRTAPAAMIDRDAYRYGVEKVLQYIRDGDIYQANFSHRFSCTTEATAADLYRRLRAESPAPFGCFIDLDGGPQILSASPELFLRKHGARAHTRPIKGTRPRGTDAAADARLRQELDSSEKERAELLMITDLLRNDLGRVAEYGSVTVKSLRELESHPTVHHAYSVIEATLRGDVGAADLLAATMPGGSVTGAPKIRAMEILDELEPVRRGPYTGCAGFIGYDGDLCLNILIRTLVRQGNDIWYQVGGGIVADSNVDDEYEETLAKGAALQRALTNI